MYYRERHPNQLSVYDKATIIEILLMLVIFSVLHSSYNGLILLVFADIFYGSKEFNSSKDKKYWFSFIILSFGMLLLSNYDLMSLFIKLPSLDTYIRFYPESVRLLLHFWQELSLLPQYRRFYDFLALLYPVGYYRASSD